MPATRHAFHLVSAALALPAILYSGRIFFDSAWSALRHGRTNMDVPISLGVSLAFALSLYDTVQNAEHAYFDAAVSLLFFLLIGRTLDHAMRERARSAVAGLAKLAPLGATLALDDGQTRYLPLDEIEPGNAILLAAGDRIPVDGVIEHGNSEVDTSLVSGESVPQPVRPGTAVQAGSMNLTGPVRMRATARAEQSFLAEMVRMMEAAEGGRARYRRLADRAAALYSPVVHGIALLSFLGWLLASGDWHASITIAIAVLIITCPCALGLAVPIVQVVAARRLFERGIMVKERLRARASCGGRRRRLRQDRDPDARQAVASQRRPNRSGGHGGCRRDGPILPASCLRGNRRGQWRSTLFRLRTGQHPGDSRPRAGSEIGDCALPAGTAGLGGEKTASTRLAAPRSPC